ncbi:signal transduction histidine kinase [Brevundimonas alba]|uniref:Signal transduction histidine kinase n=1 Tax=Brevundimonas alba TaxID=74314 RepID=A0A7X6BN29_9CAUL|nr:hypothetical protein [Brevundimonas alba]NJC41723.1 signal transduction histidine kinase [Brevundimonas alba]
MSKSGRRGESSAQFNAALAIVRGTNGGIINGLAKLRLEAPADLLRETAGAFAQHPAYRTVTLKAPFPKLASELPGKGFRYMGSFRRELAWFTGLLNLHSSKLSSFVALRDQFDHAYLIGDYTSAEGLLDRIDSELGFSCWSTQRRMELATQTSGAAARARLLNDAFESGGPSVALYLMTWFGYRATGTVSKREFDLHVRESAPLRTGLHFMLHADSGLYPELKATDVRAMIAWSDVLPLIDRYQFLLVSMQMLAANDDVDELDRQAALTNLSILEASIGDPDLSRLLCALGGDFSAPRTDPVLIAMLDNYSTGKYGAVLAQFISDSHNATVERLNIALRSHILSTAPELPSIALGLDSKTILGRIATDLHEVLCFSDGATDARLRLTKLCLTHATSAWAAALTLILDRQRHDERVKPPTRAQRVNALRCSSEHPILAFSRTDRAQTEKYLEGFASAGTPSVTASALLFVAGGSARLPSLPKHRIEHLNALRYMRSGEPAPGARSLKALVESAPPSVLRNEAELLLVESRLASGDVAGACELAADLFVERRYFGLVLPVGALIAAIMVGHNRPMSKSDTRGRISVAIVFDIYSRFVSADRDAERADSFNDVLKRFGARRASELSNVVPAEQRSQLIYFLRFVCIPQVMDQSLVLDGTRVVDDERLAVLQNLTDLAAEETPQILDAFKDEIREIRTRQVVKDTTLKLDQSKIYVNIEGIRRATDVLLRETWTRYRFMVENGSDVEYEEVDRFVVSAQEDSDVFVLTLNTPYTERAAVFKRIVSEIRDQFTSSKEFGLNSNLSANIRHGYVLRELRAPLVARTLVTNRISAEKGYQTNNYWSEKLDDDTGIRDGKLQALLSDFSAKIDERIDYLNRSLLRIRSEASPEGLFNYTLSDKALRALDELWGALETYEEFIGEVIEAMWQATEHNLKNVRSRLSGAVLQEFIDAIDELDGCLDGAGFKEDLPAIGDALAMARSDVRAAVDRVSSWFTLSAAHDYADFDLEIAVEAGLASVRAYYADLEIESSYVGPPDGMLLMGWSLPAVARLLFQLLDNAAQHGGRGRDCLTIAVTAEKNADSLLIRVLNDLPEDLLREDLATTVASINADYGQAKAMDLIGEEGGSGYSKVWKLLRADLKREHDINVSLVDDGFQVEILMNLGGLECRPS